MRVSIAIVAVSMLAGAVVAARAQGQPQAQENYESWAPIKPLFESTGGGGVMIGDYDPIASDGKCSTGFRTIEPNGNVTFASVEFDAVATQGGILCINGKWRTKDGAASGTTPYRVFIKDGIKRGSP